MHNPFSLEGKRILVTGASSGIGRCTAIECSKMGAKLVLVARREDELRKTLEALEGDGHSVEPFDLCVGEAIVKWLKQLAVRTGPMSGLVHCAGISVTMPIKASSKELYENTMGLNLASAFWAIKAFRQRGVRAPHASVVLISSAAGSVASPGLSVYCSSKAGLLGLTRGAAVELAPEDVRVNAISPALVETPMAAEYDDLLTQAQRDARRAQHPLGIGQPEDVAYAAIYLLSDAAKWVTGANFAVDGGYTAI
jgi:NAD(P)-dependent dehydrogenase (short-subunit alcohol dehydrogenase family)